MKSQIKKMIIFLSAVMMLTVLMCLNASAATQDCPIYSGHLWNEVYSCYERRCYYCDATETKDVPTHNWEDIFFSCYDYICMYCDTTKPKDVPTHSWLDFSCYEYECEYCRITKAKAEPTHDWEPFCDRRCCGRCNAVEYYAEPKHEWGIDNDYGTCGKYLHYWCENFCGETKIEENLNPTEHNLDCWEVKHPTCTEEGLMKYECDVCYEASYTEVIPATGHIYKNDWAEILSPSCTGQGVKIKVCNGCSFVNFETLAALGHSDENDDGKCDECKVLLECSGSDAETPDNTHTEHTFGEWVTEGSLSFRQCECGHIEMKVVTNGGNVEIEYPDSDEGSFEVETVEGDSFVLVEEKVAAELGGGWEVLKAFDINLKNSDGVHVQPDGSVKVKLPLDWEKEGNYKVYRVNDDGSFTDMNAYQQGSHMVFDTDHFSVYIIVEEVAVEAPAEPVPEENKKETNVFDFLIEFFNNIMDFFRKLFGIK